MSSNTLHEAATMLAARLSECQKNIVFAESCTAGLVSATLATVPGVSRFHCGSAVTYREATKTQWLGIRPEVIQHFTAVSEPVARLMATGVLQITPEADVAVAVTGHLGPDAPEAQDGLVFIAVAVRSLENDGVPEVRVYEHRLTETQRLSRQNEAAECVLRRASETLSGA